MQQLCAPESNLSLCNLSLSLPPSLSSDSLSLSLSPSLSLSLLSLTLTLTLSAPDPRVEPCQGQCAGIAPWAVWPGSLPRNLSRGVAAGGAPEPIEKKGAGRPRFPAPDGPYEPDGGRRARRRGRGGRGVSGGPQWE